MKVYVVLFHHTDGSPHIETNIEGIYTSKAAARAFIGDRPQEDPLVNGGMHQLWAATIEEWKVEE